MKVHPFKIPKPVHQSLLVQVDHLPAFYDKLHQHEEIQISCILKGSGKLLVADSIHTYGPGESVVIGKNCPHVFQSSPSTEDSHMVSLFFTKNSFGEHFFDLPEMEQLRSFFERSDAGFLLKSDKSEIVRSVLQVSRSNKLARFILFIKLLFQLAQSETQVLTGFVYPKKLSPNEGNRMQTVYDYALHNFHQDISLKKVGSLAHMTPGAFCRFFKQRTNKTFFQFLIELRIQHACQMLAGVTDHSIAEIAELSGFRSISNFNRKFRNAKGLTPTAYFKKVHGTKNDTTPMH